MCGSYLPTIRSSIQDWRSPISCHPQWFWGAFALVLAFAIPSMVSRTLYIIPEYQRVVVLKLGEYIGVRGPGRFWVNARAIW